MFARKYLVMAAAVVMMACLGGIYAWSAFAQPLEEQSGYSVKQTQAVYGTCICVFTVSMVFTGRLQDRRGPRFPSMLSGVLLGAGYLLAAWGGKQFWVLWAGIGLVGGLGIGFGYVCPIATAVKWFPRHKGLVCGLAVAGYGAGAILLSWIARRLLGQGWSVLEVFGLVGIVYGLTVILAGSQMVAPPAGRDDPPPKYYLRALSVDRRFWTLCLGFFCATFTGLTIIGSLKKIGLWLGAGEAAAGYAITALAVGNGAGRVVWGFIYDRLGSRRAIFLSFGGIVASAVAVVLARGSGAAFMTAAAFVGFCYGSCFALYAPEVARIYGAAVMGGIYPLVLVAHGLGAAIGPFLLGAGYDRFESFYPGLALAGAMPLAGMIVYAALTRRRNGAGEPGYPISPL